MIDHSIPEFGVVIFVCDEVIFVCEFTNSELGIELYCLIQLQPRHGTHTCKGKRTLGADSTNHKSFGENFYGFSP